MTFSRLYSTAAYFCVIVYIKLFWFVSYERPVLFLKRQNCDMQSTFIIIHLQRFGKFDLFVRWHKLAASLRHCDIATNPKAQTDWRPWWWESSMGTECAGAATEHSCHTPWDHFKVVLMVTCVTIQHPCEAWLHETIRHIIVTAWACFSQDLNAQLGLLPGDCIVAAGMVSYVLWPLLWRLRYSSKWVVSSH